MLMFVIKGTPTNRGNPTKVQVFLLWSDRWTRLSFWEEISKVFVSLRERLSDTQSKSSHMQRSAVVRLTRRSRVGVWTVAWMCQSVDWCIGVLFGCGRQLLLTNTAPNCIRLWEATPSNANTARIAKISKWPRLPPPVTIVRLFSDCR